MSYALEWSEAVGRSRRFGLEVPAHDVEPDRRYLGTEMYAELPYVVRDGLGELENVDVVAQCLSLHHRLIPVFEDWLQCPVLYTLGWVDTGTERGMFRFGEDFIESALRTGHNGSTVNIHAWLTLPSFEVIDMSLATTYGAIHKLPELHGSVIAKYADDLTGMAYKPMLVGSDFLRKSGMLVQFAL